MKAALGTSLLAVLLAACSPAQTPTFTDAQLDLALTELSATRTQSAFRLSASASPLAETATPVTPSPTITAALQPASPHEDGIYIVGAEIAPGLWRSVSEEQHFCYWARRKYDGVVLASYYGLPGIELRVYASDYEVELDGCGTWIYMGAN